MSDAVTALMATYNLRLVVLSIVIAIIASYTALDLTGRVTVTQGRARKLWLTSGAIAMGVGIWSMYFIGMLAYCLPIPISYDFSIILVSMVVAIIASGAALFLFSRQQMGRQQLLVGSIFLGLGIAAMHYLGIAAIRLQATPVYNNALVALSVAIAISASFIALWLAFKLRDDNTSSGSVRKIGSAIVMGLAIAGMHYTAMAAVSFKPTNQSVEQSFYVMDSSFLAVTIGISTFVILALAMLAAIFDRRIAAEVARAKVLHQAKEALRKSEERYRAFVEQSSEGIWCFESEQPLSIECSEDEQIQHFYQYGYLAECNNAMAQMYGFSHAQEIIGVRLEDLLVRSETRSIEYLRSFIRSGYRLINAESCEVDKHGNAKYFLNNLMGTVVNGVLIRAWGSQRDITERKQAEKEREQLLASEQASRAEAEAANRMKDEFLATLSHELRTPLNAMLGWTHMLRTRKFDEATTTRALETIDRNTKSLATLIEDVLDVSRIITGKLCLNVAVCELVSVIEAAITTVRPAADAKNIRIESILDPSAGPISGDSNRLQQVVWNLLSNAVKFTPKGGCVQVRLELINSRVQISVSDTGKGISTEFLPYVFERFRQADSSTTRLYGGLGLGLAIVRHLVELHGGTVHADSPGEGQGATFSVQLPLLAVRSEELEHPSPLTPHPSPLDGLRVLVVDDDADAREILTTILKQYGAEVRTVASTGEALTVFMENSSDWRPDVLMSDIGMPDEDGYALIRKVRAMEPERGGQIPAGALTAYTREQDRTQALLAGFQLHVSKPVDPAELAAVVANLAGRTGKT